MRKKLFSKYYELEKVLDWRLENMSLREELGEGTYYWWEMVVEKETDLRWEYVRVLDWDTKVEATGHGWLRVTLEAKDEGE